MYMGESGPQNAIEERKEREKATITPMTKLDALEKTGVSHGSNNAPIDRKRSKPYQHASMTPASSYRYPWHHFNNYH